MGGGGGVELPSLDTFIIGRKHIMSQRHTGSYNSVNIVSMDSI